jgi:tetratricopeptide (TPR) repeat protein
VHTIPATLQHSLMARLDRLGPAKDVAQVASVIGREFSYELLHAVSSTAEDELQSALTRLGEAELIYARGIPPEAIYQFKHALVQDAAYEALLKSRRRELHRRIANLMTERFRQTATEHPEVLAHHWSGAGELEEALAAWTRAGRTARKRRAFREAERAYRRALEVINKLPESPERDALELPVANALAQVAQLTHGYSAAETKHAVSRTLDLVRRIGNVGQISLQLAATWAAAIGSGDYRSADALSREFLELAEREGNPINLAFAHMTRIETHFLLGELAEAEGRFVHGRAFFEEQVFKQFPGALGTVLAFAGLTAYATGRIETASTRIGEAARAARQRNNPYDLAFIIYVSGSLKMLVGEPAEARAAARQAINLSDEHGFPVIAAAARITLGAALANCGEPGHGVQLIEEGLKALAETEARLGVTLSLSYLAQAQSLHGENDKALYTIDRALEANPDERIYRPEVLRLRGELRLRAADRERAAEDFREAIACARGMGAKSFELHATASLARLLRDNNRREEARAMLAEIYNWFTEGFDTADLKDAKALLEELSGSP